jgi:glycosyltransferase involved in cell wall biosynthesis
MTNVKVNTLSVVIPVYNSEATLPTLLERLQPVLTSHASQAEVILVNDGSPDRSWDVIEQLMQEHDWVRGGALLLTVPAHPMLWSYFDEASRHHRRYKPDELASKLVEAGYRIEYMSQYMAGIFPMVWVGRRLAARLRACFKSQNHSF